MYSDKKNILQLTFLLQAHGVRDVVLCPGSRNAAIVHTLAQAEGLRCHAVTDERSAGFFAIGLAQATEKAVAVCCTSGSALVNLHPAVAEAFYRQIPLIVISADRPAAWIGQMDGQTLPQPGVFGTLVKCAVNLPDIHTDEDEWHCNRLLNEALLTATHLTDGPVHINLPVSEPIYRFTAEAIPPTRVIRRVGLPVVGNAAWEHLRKEQEGCTRRMLLLGQMPPAKGRQMTLPDNAPYVALAEHLSNTNGAGKYIGNGDVLLYGRSPEELEALRPDLLITCGGHIVSGRLKKFLRNHPPRAHWHVTPDGQIADTYRSLTTAIACPPESFMDVLPALLDPADTSYDLRWQTLSTAIAPPSRTYSALSAVGDVLNALPEHCTLHLANSSAVRYAQLFPLPVQDVEVHCNRGVNGIEGSVSAAVGHAAASQRLNFLLIGDLSFFYDMNALWQQDIRPNLRILLLNNSGGEIFRTLPGMEHPTDTARFIMGTHRTSPRGWAEERGFRYLSASCADEWQDACRQLTDPHPQDRPLLVEVFTDMEADVVAMKGYYRAMSDKIQDTSHE